MPVVRPFLSSRYQNKREHLSRSAATPFVAEAPTAAHSRGTKADTVDVSYGNDDGFNTHSSELSEAPW